jgi:hypothetical protein
MSILKTHNTRRTLQAMAERHRKDARTLAMLHAEIQLEPGEMPIVTLQAITWSTQILKTNAENLENLAAPEGDE